MDRSRYHERSQVSEEVNEVTALDVKGLEGRIKRGGGNIHASPHDIEGGPDTHKVEERHEKKEKKSVQ